MYCNRYERFWLVLFWFLSERARRKREDCGVIHSASAWRHSPQGDGSGGEDGRSTTARFEKPQGDARISLGTVFVTVFVDACQCVRDPIERTDHTVLVLVAGPLLAEVEDAVVVPLAKDGVAILGAGSDLVGAAGVSVDAARRPVEQPLATISWNDEAHDGAFDGGKSWQQQRRRAVEARLVFAGLEERDFRVTDAKAGERPGDAHAASKLLSFASPIAEMLRDHQALDLSGCGL